MSDVYLPVLKDTKDPHYRYKMPKLTAKIEGSGNGIKTVITNMVAVAKAIGRPPSYPTKYFGCELGAQVTIANDLYIVNGSHDPDKLLNLLYGFIKKFVLCTKCSNPETTLTISGQTIKQKCQACGYETVIPKAMHKLTTFIINHPPESNGNSSSAPPSSKGKTKSKSSKGDKSDKSSKTKKSEQPESNEVNGVACGDDDDDGFDDEELSPEAIAERKRELCEGQTGIYMTDSKEIANLFYKLVKEKKEAGVLGDPQVQKDLVREAENLSMKDKAPLILCELLFTGDNMLAEIKTNRLLLLRFVSGNKKAQKYLLGGYEKLVGDVFKEKLFDKAMAVLKLLYDEDILEEESILAWASKESKKYVGKEMSRKIHEKVAPFIKWLREAEEEEDDEDDEEEDENEESDGSSSKSNDSIEKTTTNNNKHTNGSNGASKANQHAATANHDDDDDDDETEVEFSHRVSGITIQEVKPTATAANTAAAASNAVSAAATSADADLDDLDIDNI